MNMSKAFDVKEADASFNWHNIEKMFDRRKNFSTAQLISDFRALRLQFEMSDDDFLHLFYTIRLLYTAPPSKALCILEHMLNLSKEKESK